MSKNMTKHAKSLCTYLEDLAENDKVLDTKQKFLMKTREYIKKKYLNKILKISFFGSYTIDIMSSCCFGMEVNSINDPGNEFIKQLIIANSLNFGRLKTSLLCIIFNYLSICLKVF